MYLQENLVTGGAGTKLLIQSTWESVKSQWSRISPTEFNTPHGIAFDQSGNLWVSDWSNYRILKFKMDDLAIGASASIVLGQTDFTSNDIGRSSTKIHEPAGINFDQSGNLWVAEPGSNRILMFPQENLVTGGEATVVIGQTDFTSGGSSTLNEPYDVAFDSSGNLWVADRNSNRVLMYPSTDLFTGSNPKVVIGASAPNAIAFDSSGNLWVAAQNQNAILKFPSDNLISGATASVTLGGNVCPAYCETTSSTLWNPKDVAFDSSGNLWVADTTNNRLLMFDSQNQINGGAASVVLGQPDFNSRILNWGNAVSSTTMAYPTSILADSSGNLWAVDATNDRILRYSDVSGQVEKQLITDGNNSLNLEAFTTDFDLSDSFDSTKIEVEEVTTNPQSTDPSGTITGNFFVVESNAPIYSTNVTLTYSDIQISGLDESTLTINRYSNDAWSSLTTEVDPVTNTLTAESGGFSTFVISGQSIVKPTFTAQRTGLNTIKLIFSEYVDSNTSSGEGYSISSGTITANSDPNGASNIMTLTTSGLSDTSSTPTITYHSDAGSTTDVDGNEVDDGFYTVTSDGVNPTVLIKSLSATSPTNDNPIAMIVQFSEPIVGFTEDDISVNPGSYVSDLVSIDASTYTFNLNHEDIPGTITLDIMNGVVEDFSGNENIMASKFTIDYVSKRTFTLLESGTSTLSKSITKGPYTFDAGQYRINMSIDATVLIDSKGKIIPSSMSGKYSVDGKNNSQDIIDQPLHSLKLVISTKKNSISWSSFEGSGDLKFSSPVDFTSAVDKTGLNSSIVQLKIGMATFKPSVDSSSIDFH